jgi:hypothetical protein
METMIWPDEVRAADFAFLDDDVDLREAELKMADSLVESMAGDFDPGDYSDDYREALQEVIDAKAAGRQVVEAPAATGTDGGAVIDLMAALRASVSRPNSAERVRPPVVPAKGARKPPLRLRPRRPPRRRRRGRCRQERTAKKAREEGSGHSVHLTRARRAAPSCVGGRARRCRFPTSIPPARPGRAGSVRAGALSTSGTPPHWRRAAGGVRPRPAPSSTN